MTPPRPFVVEHDGLRIAGLDWGGGGTPLLLLHPNGFNAGFFDPVARRLAGSGRFRPVGIDLRGHVLEQDGTVELACPPEVEAAIFGSPPVVAGVRAAWEHLAHLSAPGVILAGASSDLATEWFEEQAERAGAPFVLVDGGHFFLHENTDRAVALVTEHLG